MSTPTRRPRAPAALHASAIFALATLTPVTAPAAADATLSDVSITSSRFDEARNALSPGTGSSRYVFDSQTLETLPAGRNTSLTDMLLQAPGVVANSQGQLHVRGDHADLQYRINGVILPEGITGFSQVLSPRFAQDITLSTGALPAQYGERTAGVIDITSRRNFSGGDVGIYGGGFGTVEPTLDLGYTTPGGTTGFLSGSFLHSRLGTEKATPDYNPIHDATQQARGFGYFATPLTPTLRLNIIAGTTYGRFEIPNTPGQDANAVYEQFAALTAPDSRNLNARQYERNTFGIVALQGAFGAAGSWQLAAFNRISSLDYTPDPSGGDLLYNGVSAPIARKADTWGLQGDLNLPLAASHTLRAGFVAQLEDDRSDNRSTVFPTVDAVSGSCPPGSLDAGEDEPQCVSGAPTTIVDNHRKSGNTLAAVYAEDQWNISDRVTVNYGLRFTQLNAYITSNALSPRLGMVWYIDPNTTFHAGYARYFTPPPNQLVSSTSIAKLADTTNAPEVVENSPVKPERAHYFDIGIARQVSPSWNIGLDSYYKYARNLLDEGQFGNALIFTPFNLDRAHVYGVELTNAFKHGNWSAYLNVARSMAKGTGVTSGQFNLGPDELRYIDNHYVFLDHTQLWTVSAGTAYRWRQTVFSLDGTYQDGLRNDGPDGIPNSGKQPPYVVLNAAVVQTFNFTRPGPLKVRVAALNLLDRSYQIHDGTGIGVNRAEYGARRGVYLGLTQSF
ncbi:MAG: TonB-dependent receptor [Nevskiaceae bacterium]|nr:MAG: TonB-dependent receptor [Nevskiaceae bacterium]TBR73592.1 MAG: TonB-dependent receptor [Nevskiaceae bacterium]